MWIVESDGSVHTETSARLGFVDVNGDIYLPDRLDALGYPYGAHPNGNAHTDGSVVDGTLAYVGHVANDGVVHNSLGVALATVDGSGAVHSVSRVHIGSISPSIHNTPPTQPQPNMIGRAAAAVLLVMLSP